MSYRSLRSAATDIKNQGGMSEEKPEAISRRKALSFLGLGSALVLVAPTLFMSHVEAQETGTERRQERRTRRTERRQERRTRRTERRQERRKGREERREIRRKGREERREMRKQ
jgi:hypothetical protein